MIEMVEPARPVSWPELFTVAWRRSWAFTGLYRRSTVRARKASRRWSWQWVVVAWQAVGQCIPMLIGTGAGAGEIWTARSASATVQKVGDRRPVRPGGLALAVAVVLSLTALVGVEAAVVLTGVGLIPAATLATVLILGALVATVRGRSEGPRRLARRSRELTAGPAVVVTSVVAGHRGDGRALMQALQRQWQGDGTVLAILYAGTDDLVGYYATQVGGWALDGTSTRRMVWTAGGRP